MSEDFSNFMSMNDDMKLRLAYAEIARLKDALSESNRGQITLSLTMLNCVPTSIVSEKRTGSSLNLKWMI